MTPGQSILLYGPVLSVALSAVIVGTLYCHPRLLLRSYPPAIKRRAGAQTAAERKKTAIVGLFFLPLLIGVPAVSTRLLERAQGGDIAFSDAFLNVFGIMTFFNAVDLLVIDGLLFCALTPKFLVIEGTEGMAEYKDFCFHFRGFVVGTLLTAAASLVMAGLFAFL